jgi:hypothetical protein
MDAHKSTAQIDVCTNMLRFLPVDIILGMRDADLLHSVLANSATGALKLAWIYFLIQWTSDCN